MSIFTFIKKINNKTKELDKRADNPFLSISAKYDPFKNAFSQTYVWIEEEEKSKKE